jgi:hypothetical protein
MIMIKRSLVLVGLLFVFACLLTSVTFAQEAEGGDYYIAGTQLNGDPYTGGLEILQNIGEEYLTLSWQIAEPFYGQGILTGGVLSAGWGTNCTLASYLTQEGGNLTGQWADTSTGQLNPEFATVVDSSDSMISWAISGEFSDGTVYEGTMTFTPNADQNSAIVQQQIGDTTISGIALLDEGVLTVVYGGEGCGVGSYLVQDNSDLMGRWTLVGQTTVGSEMATLINISGSHNISGTNLDGTAYEGTLEVTPNNQIHTFDYTLGEQQFPGVGILRGNVISVGFGGEQCSVASYFVSPDGTLKGLWTVVGSDTVGSENAFRTDEPIYAEGAMIPDVAGIYDVEGTSPVDGSPYAGKLGIIPRGDVYQFSWEFANGTAEGIGILVNNTIMVGYGGEGCAVNAYRVSEESLDGVWGAYGNNALGTETATR